MLTMGLYLHHASSKQTQFRTFPNNRFVFNVFIGISVLLALPSSSLQQEPFVKFISSSSNQTVWLGDQVALTCSLQIDSDPATRGDKSVYWQHSGDNHVRQCAVPLKDITDSRTTNASCQQGFTGHVTTIEQTRTGDSITVEFVMLFAASRDTDGSYRCTVVGGSPTQFSTYKHVTALTPPSCHASLPINFQAHEGDEITVICRNHNTERIQPSSLKWQISRAGNQEIPTEQTLENGSSIIYNHNLKPSDNQLTLECTESHPNMETMKSCSVGPLNVLYSPRGHITRHNSSDSWESPFDNFITIYSCEFDANPPVANLEWFSDGIRIKSDDLDDNYITEGTGRFLHVIQDPFSTLPTIDTILECRASNSIGNGSANITHSYMTPQTASKSDATVAGIGVGAFLAGVVMGIISSITFVFIRSKCNRKDSDMPSDVELSPQKENLLQSDAKRKRKNRYETTVGPKLKPALAPKPNPGQDKGMTKQLSAPKYQNTPPVNKNPSPTKEANVNTSKNSATYKTDTPSAAAVSSGYTPLNLQGNPDDYYEALDTSETEKPSEETEDSVYANIDNDP